MSPAHTPGFNSTNDVHGLNSQGSIGSVGSRIDGTGPIRRIIRDIKTEVKVAIFDMAQKPKPIDFPHRVTARVEKSFVSAPFEYFWFQKFSSLFKLYYTKKPIRYWLLMINIIGVRVLERLLDQIKSLKLLTELAKLSGKYFLINFHKVDFSDFSGTPRNNKSKFEAS